MGRADSTLKKILQRLNDLKKNVDLDKPEQVKQFITNKDCSDGYKDNLIDAYSHYCDYCGIQWTKPKYYRVEQIKRVPKEEDINKVISHSTLKYAVAYSIMRDIGLRPVELGMLKAIDIDLETGEIYPITAKHGYGRVLQVRKSTLAMLKKYINRDDLTSNSTLWKAKRVKQNWGRLKSSVAKKLNEPQLNQIRLCYLRHFAVQ